MVATNGAVASQEENAVDGNAMVHTAMTTAAAEATVAQTVQAAQSDGLYVAAAATAESMGAGAGVQSEDSGKPTERSPMHVPQADDADPLQADDSCDIESVMDQLPEVTSCIFCDKTYQDSAPRLWHAISANM